MKNEALLKFTSELQTKLAEALVTKEYQQLITVVRQSSDEDSGTFEVMITTNDVDRAGEVINLDGWDFTNYLKSPVVLWGHDYSKLPVGVCTSLTKTDKGILAKGRFAPAAANPYAQQVRALYDLGIVRATSVGFIPQETEGNTIMKAELLEFSFVAVPCNPHALSILSAKNLAVGEFVAKGIMFEEKKEEETKEEKGAVADDVAAQNACEEKYANCEDVFDIMNAFMDVYFDEKVAPADFGKLLNETVTLLKQVADGSYTEPAAAEPVTDAQPATVTTVANALRTRGKTVFSTLVKEFKEKGALVEKKAEAIRHTVASLKLALIALEELTASEGKKVEAKTSDEGKDFLVVRGLMQEVATILGDGLADLSARAKKYY